MDEVILSCWSSLYTELNHNPIKWCREEQSSYSLGFTSHSLHPNPEEMGKWSFQLLLMAGPGPLGLRGPQSSDLLQLILFSSFKIPLGWLDHSNPACFTAITTLCIHCHFLQQQSYLTKDETHRQMFFSYRHSNLSKKPLQICFL